MSNPGSATTHSSRACRALTLVTLAVLVLATVARGDIGIRKLMSTSARPGEQITVVAAGYLGPRPWRPMPVVMIPAKLAPKPRRVPGGLGSPIARRSDLRPPRYRIVGAVRNWRQLDGTAVNATGALRFRLPPVRPGRYVFALFCDPCRSGPRGSLVIDPRLVLAVAA